MWGEVLNLGVAGIFRWSGEVSCWSLDATGVDFAGMRATCSTKLLAQVEQ